jgi:hypothetical protein
MPATKTSNRPFAANLYNATPIAWLAPGEGIVLLICSPQNIPLNLNLYDVYSTCQGAYSLLPQRVFSNSMYTFTCVASQEGISQTYSTSLSMEMPRCLPLMAHTMAYKRFVVDRTAGGAVDVVSDPHRPLRYR